MSGGLPLYSRRLAEACESADTAQRRAMSEVGARLAVFKTGLVGPEVAAALDALLSARFGDGSERQALKEFVERLDETAFDLQDALEEGGGSEQEYLQVFRRARAASSLFWALDDDPGRAVGNALYEAITALDEQPGAVEPVVLDAAARAHRG